jgi:hypothetical protein
MTTLCKVWACGNNFEFATSDQAEQYIHQLEQETKSRSTLCAVQVSTSDSTGILITVGGSESYTQFYDAHARPPIVAALGPHNDDTLIQFDLMGELSQIERRYWIPIEESYEALKYYLLTGKRLEKVHWEKI